MKAINSLRKKAKPIKQISARAMRANPTPSEKVLWDELRAKKLGVKFRRQAIIMGWIADFYCPSKRLVVELDGKIHGEIESKNKDIERDRVMRNRGLRVLRIRSYRVFHELPKVLKEIRQMLIVSKGDTIE